MRQTGVVEGEASTDMYSTAGELKQLLSTLSVFSQAVCGRWAIVTRHEPPHMSRYKSESFQSRRRFFMSIHVRLHCVRR